MMKSIRRNLNRSNLLTFLFKALCGFLWLLNRSIMLMPATLLFTLMIACYFVPEQILTDVINTFSSAATGEKITLVRLFLYTAFLLSFAACFLDTLITYPRNPLANVRSAKDEHKL